LASNYRQLFSQGYFAEGRAMVDSVSIPTFKILALGMRGSGKTVFLASMYHHLMAYRENLGYYLYCADEKQSADLLDKFSEISESDDWPEGNSTLDEYVFDCFYMRPNNNGSEKVCRFSYIDYPGGWILGQGEPTIHIAQAALESDSILLLLDGRKIKDLLDGTYTTDDRRSNQKPRSILDDIQKMTPILNQCISSRKPLHILITKSDILNPKIYPLGKIQDALLKVEPFKRALTQQAQGMAVHMAPVSSVGEGFVAYDKATGQMSKNSGATIRPFNVDLSIALTMYDHLKAIADRVDPSVAQSIKSGQRKKKIFETIEKALSSVSSPVSLFLASNLSPDGGLSVGIGTLVIERFVNGFHEYLGKKKEDIDAEILRMRNLMTDKNSAFGGILSIQSLLIARFEERLPESNLARRLLAQ
jgi:hypothetical protein